MAAKYCTCSILRGLTIKAGVSPRLLGFRQLEVADSASPSLPLIYSLLFPFHFDEGP
uniref:Uncharacterized protein n=1 Tax=Physcomitrium patens TaxID=3218 RepID=A0A2K1KXI9_PHYPA|nr:hypothetical protein PHYPA_005465 [Physcomitrium patens]